MELPKISSQNMCFFVFFAPLHDFITFKVEGNNVMTLTSIFLEIFVFYNLFKNKSLNIYNFKTKKNIEIA